MTQHPQRPQASLPRPPLNLASPVLHFPPYDAPGAAGPALCCMVPDALKGPLRGVSENCPEEPPPFLAKDRGPGPCPWGGSTPSDPLCVTLVEQHGPRPVSDHPRGQHLADKNDSTLPATPFYAQEPPTSEQQEMFSQKTPLFLKSHKSDAPHLSHRRLLSSDILCTFHEVPADHQTPGPTPAPKRDPEGLPPKTRADSRAPQPAWGAGGRARMQRRSKPAGSQETPVVSTRQN